MTYLLPQDIAKELWISLKTVYNYISKSWSNVRTEKRNWKTFVNFVDLQSYLQLWVQNLQNNYNNDNTIIKENTVETTSLKELWNLQSNYNKLQSEFNYISTKAEQLEKMSSNFQDMAQKYAIRLSEEKDEKKALQEKYDNLEKSYLDNVKAYSSLQVGSVKKLYLTWGIVAILVILFGLLLALYLRKLYIF